MKKVRQRRPKKLGIESLEPRIVLSADSVVTFNEVMYNPASGNPAHEWIELHNQMSVNVDISDWKIIEGVDFVFSSGTVIDAGEYLVIAADAAALQAATGFADAIGSYTGYLSNSGETIVLRDHNDRLMDRLDYSDSGDWPVAADGSGATLDKRSRHLPSELANSWTHSATVLGTPGATNLPPDVDDGSGATATTVGEDNTTNSGWRTAADLESDNQYGTDGYVLYGINEGNNVYQPIYDATSVVSASPLSQVSLPAYITDVSLPNTAFWSGNGNFGLIQNPGNGNNLTSVPVLANGPSPYEFTIARANNTPFRLTLLLADGDNIVQTWNTTVDAGSPTTASTTGISNGANNLTYQVFDIGEGTANILVSVQALSGDSGRVVGFAFDSIAPLASSMVGSIAPTRVHFNEVAGAVDGSFFVELYNAGDTTVDLASYTITATGLAGGSYEIPSGSLASGAYFSINEGTLGFHPQDEAKIFLYNGDDSVVLDAARVENTLRGRSTQHEGRWQRSDVSTPGAVNSFAFSDEIVINEIMYHHFPTQSSAEVVQTTTTVDFDSTWRYNQTGNNLGTDWGDTAHTVDNVAWFSGAGLLALEASPLPAPINTMLSLGPTTFYFETDFEFNGNLADIDRLRLSHIIDDGAVFYVNGVEVWRHNMPGNIGEPVAASTLAMPGIGNAFVVGLISLSADQLVVGTNRLSVEVHQASAGSSDVVMGSKLELVETTVPGTAFDEDSEEWIELYNKSNQAVDLSGWQLDDAVSFTFANGTILNAGEYLVVAREATSLAAKYPSITIAGEFSGKLSNNDERIQLIDAGKNVADEVHYFEGGRWSELADGGGSSLELRDPDADNSQAEAWAASDETGKSAWQTVSYRGIATSDGIGIDIYNELVIGLLDSGEVLVDDLSIVHDPDGAATQLLQNGTFELDTHGTSPAAWRLIGTHGSHGNSVVLQDPDNVSNQVLQLVSTGWTQDKHNHGETTFIGNTAIVVGQEYEISYRAKWLSGSNQLNTRLYFNYLQATNRLAVPRDNGTPGGQNSRFEANVGPTYSDLQHGPVIPSAGEDVIISVTAEDPENVAAMSILYSVNGGGFSSVAMTSTSGGRFHGKIPGQLNGAIVQFYVQGQDGLGAISTFPAAGADSRALYKVQNFPVGSSKLQSTRLIMTSTDQDFLYLNTNRGSNDRMGATFVYEDGTVFYDVDVRLKGQSFRRNAEQFVSYNVRFDPENLFRGVHGSVVLSQGTLWELLAKQLFNHAGGGLSSFYDDYVYVDAPRSQDSGVMVLSMARTTDLFLDSQFENGSDGSLFNLELLYTPNGTVDGNPESLKLNFPYSHVNGNQDIAVLGPDQEAYRWNLQLRNNRAKDDFSRIIELAEAFDLTGSALDAATQQVMDVDQWMRHYALMTLSQGADFYTRVWNHNFRIFQHPEDNRMVAMAWDLDGLFGMASNSPLWGGTNFQKIIELPTNTRLFYGHLLDLMETTINSTYVSTWATHYASLSGSSSQLNSAASNATARAAYVLSQIPAHVPFTITTNGGADFSTAKSLVTLAGDGWVDVREIRLTGNPNPLEVTWIDVDSWQVVVPIAPGANLLSLEAFNHQGSLIGSDSITVTSTATIPLADASNLRITELNYNPQTANPVPGLGEQAVDNDQFEFVELQNIHQVDTINLVSAQFSSAVGSASYTFGANTLAPGERIILARDQAAFESRFGTGVNVAGVYAGKLQNSGDSITLLAADSSVIQQFSYDDSGDWPGRADGTGSSLEIVDAAGDYNDANNWRSSSEFGGSPGFEGAGPVRDVIVNEVLSHSDGAALDLIELYNTSASAVDLDKWYVSDTNNNLYKFQFTDNTTLGAGQYLVLNETQLGFELDDQLDEDVWLVAADSATGKPVRFANHVEFEATDTDVSLGRWANGDPGGTLFPMSTQTFGSANSGPVLGDVLISEVHYHPASVPPAEAGNITQDELEFVELANVSGGPFEISNWKVDGINFTFPAGTVLANDEAIVLVTFDPTLEPAKATAFRNVFGIGVGPRLFGAASGQLNNAGERVELFKPEDPVTLLTGDVLVDAVRYDELAPWPTAANGGGDSLQRTAVNAFGGFAASWQATPGTPGSANLAIPSSGDFDGDTDVDGSDFLAWQRGFGTTGTAMPADGDANGDNHVDAVDLGIWQMQYGSTSPIMAAAMMDDSSQSVSMAAVVEENATEKTTANYSELASLASLSMDATTSNEEADTYDLAYVSYVADDRRTSSLELDTIPASPQSPQDEVFATLEGDRDPLETDLEEHFWERSDELPTRS